MLPLAIMVIEDDNDRQFVTDLYARYQPALFRKALGILNDDTHAEEAVHEAILKVIRYLDRIREIPPDELLPYLLTIVQTASIDIYNKTKQHHKNALGYEDDWADGFSDEGDCIEDVLIRQEQADLLKECLSILSQREIDILNYCYTLELPSKEIARLTGLAPANVRMVISRAKKKVLSAYAAKGGRSHE